MTRETFARYSSTAEALNILPAMLLNLAAIALSLKTDLWRRGLPATDFASSSRAVAPLAIRKACVGSVPVAGTNSTRSNFPSLSVS